MLGAEVACFEALQSVGYSIVIFSVGYREYDVADARVDTCTTVLEEKGKTEEYFFLEIDVLRVRRVDDVGKGKLQV